MSGSEPQRFAICRVSPTDDDQTMGQINAVREIDAPSVADFRGALNHIRRYMQFDLLQLVYLNLMGHMAVHDEMSQDTADPMGLVRTRSTRSAHLILTSLLNFCTSVHALQEHNEAQAARLGGSALKANVHALFSDAYDAGDELFFVRKLRDVLVHSTLQVFNYHASFMIEVEGEPPVARAETFFVRSALLEQRRSFNDRVRAWISTQDERFEIFPVLEKAFEQLHSMYPEVVVLTNPELLMHAGTVNGVCDDITRAIGDCEDLLIYPCTPDFSPDTANLHLGVVLYPEVIAYARALWDEAPPDGPFVV